MAYRQFKNKKISHIQKRFNNEVVTIITYLFTNKKIVYNLLNVIV